MKMSLYFGVLLCSMLKFNFTAFDTHKGTSDSDDCLKQTGRAREKKKTDFVFRQLLST